MHCQTCGAEAAPGLKYCKRCGASLNMAASAVASNSPLPKLAGMFWAISIFGLGSLSVLFGALIALAAVGVHGDMLVMVGMLGSATVIVIAMLLVWQLSRLVTLAKGLSRSVQTGSLNQPPAYEQPRIAAPPAVMPSVTEHTTRNFEPAAYKEPGERQ